MDNIEKYKDLCHIHTMLGWIKNSHKFKTPVEVKYFDKEFFVTEICVENELVYCKTVSGIELIEDGICAESIRIISDILENTIVPPKAVIADMIEIYAIRTVDNFRRTYNDETWPQDLIYEEDESVRNSLIAAHAETIYNIAVGKVKKVVPSLVKKEKLINKIRRNMIDNISHFLIHGYFSK